MLSQAGHFTDREEALAAFDRLMSSGPSKARALVYWGVSGQGKSALLRHLQENSAARERCALIDLDPLLAVDAPSIDLGRDVASVLVDHMAQVIADWSSGTRRARRRYARFRSRVRRSAAASPTYVNTHMNAASNSSIRETTIHVDATGDRATVDRDVLIDELRRLARRLRRRRCVLLLDTSERLRLLADTTAGPTEPNAPRGGVAQWFTSELLPKLLAEAPGLRIVLAGREPADYLPVDIVAERIELTEWSPEHTAEYLASCGLDSERLARPVHTVCRGLPVWTALVAELARQEDDSDEDVTPQWLSDAARGRAASEWLPNQFLRRLPTEQRRVVMAAATLRSVSKESVGTLLEGTKLAPDWYETLCSYSFVRIVRDSRGQSERRIHDLVRLAVLTYLEREEPAYRQSLHRRAAEYFAVRESFLEEAYHRFAAGDHACADTWWNRRRELKRADDTDELLRLTEIVTAPEQAPHTFRRFPHIAAEAALTGAHIAFDQDRDDDAESLARQAYDGFRGVGHREGEARALGLLGKVAATVGSDDATGLLEEALRLNRTLGRKKAIGHVLPRLAELQADTDLRAAVGFLEEAHALLLEAGDHKCAAEAILHRADLGRRTGDDPEYSEELYRRTLDEFCRLEHPIGKAMTMKSLAGLLLDETTQYEEAESLLLEASRIFRDEEWFWAEISAFDDLCTLLRRTGRANEAEKRYRISLARCKEVEADEAAVLHNLATLLMEKHALGEAEALLRRSVALCRENGDIAKEAHCHFALAKIARREGKRVEEGRALEQAGQLADTAGVLELRADVMHSRAHFAKGRQLYDESELLFAEEILIRSGLDTRSEEAVAWSCRGHLAMTARRFGDAKCHFEQALRIYRALGDTERVASTLVTLGDAAVRTGHEQLASQCYDEAIALLGGESDGKTASPVTLLQFAFVTMHRSSIEDPSWGDATGLVNRSLNLALDRREKVPAFLSWMLLALLGAWGGDREAKGWEALDRVMSLLEGRHTLLWMRLAKVVARRAMNMKLSSPHFMRQFAASGSYVAPQVRWDDGLLHRARVVLTAFVICLRSLRRKGDQPSASGSRHGDHG